MFAVKKVAPIKKIAQLWSYRELIYQLTRRDLLARYKGSYLGFAWALLTPLVMLFIYSFIFVIVFKLKWGLGTEESKTLYTLMIFSGLIPFYIFSESINRSLVLISGNPNYIKKVVFPLEILPISLVISTIINNIFGLILLLVAKLVFLQTPSLPLLLIPILFVPLIFLSLGLAFAFSALGAYIRDLTHSIALVVNMLFYMSPIFYQTSIVPEPFRSIVNINPLTSIIEQWRDVILLGRGIDYGQYGISLFTSVIVLAIGYFIFQYLRKGFSDVI
ncbi:ABC-2 type transporter [Aneurinibacillus migulanus]|nr:ABC-2 type transporter [Aneurinibacillus migulanus]